MDKNQNKIFVAGIRDATRDEVAAFFEREIGHVTLVQIATDRTTGKPRGFCFVQFWNPPEVEAALTLDGALFNGRPLTIRIATPTPPPPRRAATMAAR